jgi:nucleotidyltransferase substrate binding protein (TIGR01987 family)
MSEQRPHERINDYQRATHQLAKAVARPMDEFMRDSVIQRFAVAYELAWKMLKLRLEQEAMAVSTPRQVLQAALQAGFISDGNAWTELQSNRNLTTHTHDEALAQRVYEFVQREGLALFEELAMRAGEWNSAP